MGEAAERGLASAVGTGRDRCGNDAKQHGRKMRNDGHGRHGCAGHEPGRGELRLIASGGRLLSDRRCAGRRGGSGRRSARLLDR